MFAHQALSGGRIAALFFFLIASYYLALQALDWREQAVVSDAPNVQDFYLRILPYGASITKGLQSRSEGYNGYRKHLRDKLRADGWKVNMVGDRKSGTMKDNDYSGIPGRNIVQTHARLPDSLVYQPNLVLVNLGTNNAVFHDASFEDAGDSLIALLQDIYDGVPDVAIVLSTLLPCVRRPWCGHRTEVINHQYRTQVMNHFSHKGRKLVLADMHRAIGEEHLAPGDGVHPLDSGYRIMADVWYDAIQKADISPPHDAPGVKDDAPAKYTCDKKLDDDNGMPDRVQDGFGISHNPYEYDAEDAGHVLTLATGTENINWGEDVHFADLVKTSSDGGRELDEAIWVDGTGAGVKYYFWTNQGGGNFTKRQQFNPPMECNSFRVRWADLDGDGLDDMICLDPFGAPSLALNKGGNPPRFESKSIIFSPPPGTDPSMIRITDVDGDGRADYCRIEGSSGGLNCWRNLALAPSMDKWVPAWGPMSQQDSHVAFKGPEGMTISDASMRGVQFADLNGDARPDWIWVEESGASIIYLNRRTNGLGVMPSWEHTDSSVVAASLRGPAMSANGSSLVPRVRFARIFGSGRADTVLLEPEASTSLDYETTFTQHVRAWRNTGAGGEDLRSDGVRYCDMNGDGLDDYVRVTPGGNVTMYLNIQDFFIDPGLMKSPLWEKSRQQLALGDVAPADVHVADVDGDGLCDVVHLDARTGAARVWRNDYDGQKFSFTDLGARQPLSEAAAAACASLTKSGGRARRALRDEPVRLADMDGDGRADYVCVAPDGRMRVFRNNNNNNNNNHNGSEAVSFGDGGSGGGGVDVNVAAGLARAELRLADVNGDGRADLVHVDALAGAGRVWRNDGGGAVWADLGVRFAGRDRGESIYFAKLGYQWRADMVKLNPDASAFVWWNKCHGAPEPDFDHHGEDEEYGG